jgi:hypothetical protein
LKLVEMAGGNDPSFQMVLERTQQPVGLMITMIYNESNDNHIHKRFASKKQSSQERLNPDVQRLLRENAVVNEIQPN